MKLKLDEMKEIAKRLPIGYYLGRKVPVEVVEGNEAKCDTIKAVISIGLGLLQDAADNVSPEEEASWDREKLLRCILYHEIGHLLLTPTSLPYVVNIRDKKRREIYHSFEIVNIFEDERIETVLSCFFYGVDFRGFVRLSARPSSGKAGDVEMFYDAVRLRKASPAILKAVDDTLCALSKVTKSRTMLILYGEKVSELYNKIMDEAEKKSEGGGAKDGGDLGESGGKPMPKPDDSDANPDGDARPDEGDSEGEAKPDEGDGETGDDGSKPPPSDGDDSGEDCDDGGDDSEETGAADTAMGKPDTEAYGDTVKAKCERIGIPDDLLEQVANRTFVTPPSEVSKALERFAVRLSKKKGAQAAGRWSGLHGRIDTKRDAMDKERIFRRSSDVGESLMSAVNLVLWIDVSGSFSGSAGALNQILAATATAVGMSGGKLAVKVVKIGEMATVAGPDDWAIKCDQFNSINMTYHKAWLDTRDKTRRNIDIVVLDGDAKSDEFVESETMPDGSSIEKKIWDNPDCHIVCDESNKEYFGDFTRGHVTYVNGKYADHLQDEVMKTLDRIL